MAALDLAVQSCLLAVLLGLVVLLPLLEQTMRGVVMGGYSTALYLGLALGSLALGPVIVRHGYTMGFLVGGVTGAVGAVVASVLWLKAQPLSRRPPPETR